MAMTNIASAAQLNIPENEEIFLDQVQAYYLRRGYIRRQPHEFFCAETDVPIVSHGSVTLRLLKSPFPFTSSTD
jgi:hypothetical protein